MARPLKYKTADDLLNHCHIHNDCYVWPESSCPIPMIGPASPMAVKFGTTSVVRILFILCKYIPLGKRLVRRCQTQFCVNPFHYTESAKYMAKRAKLANPNGLFPQQEDNRDLIAPSDTELDTMRPKDPLHLKRLMESGNLAGFDCEGIPDGKKYVPPRFRKPNHAGIEPVLVMKGFDPETLRRRDEPAKKLTDEEWDEIERGFMKKESLPEVVDEIDPEVDHTNGEVDIFEAIRRRKEWELKK